MVVAAKYDLELNQMGIKIVFLNEDIDKTT